jgi:hypothetical protein
MGIEARQFGEWSERRCTGDRATVWTGAVRQDRDQPKVRLPSSGCKRCAATTELVILR